MRNHLAWLGALELGSFASQALRHAFFSVLHEFLLPQPVVSEWRERF
jgi:hypothetical protein